MTDLKPPFRADHVGSLLRPASIVEARKKFYQDKSIDAAELKAVEDAAIPELIKMQKDVGLKAVTDGEARRSFWHYDFMGMLTGLDLDERQDLPLRLPLLFGRQAGGLALLPGGFRFTHLLLQLRRTGLDNLEETYRGRNPQVGLRLIGNLQGKLLSRLSL